MIKRFSNQNGKAPQAFATVVGIAVGLMEAVLLVCLLVFDVCAFTADEHKRLGDKAIKIAFDMNHIDCINIKDDLYLSLCDLLDSNKDRVSYGDIVKMIDYMYTPSVMFVQIGPNIRYPRKYEDLNPNFFGKYKRTTESYLRSSHNNDAHFNGQLLFELHDWHKRALWIANSGERNLFAALMANAVSDHYLHDFFAPGHVITARYNFHDTFALGIHDINNYFGASFNIKNIDSLFDIISFIEKNQTKYESYGFTMGIIELLKRKQSIFLHGDNFLSENPLQECLMTLVEVKSINEVIESYYANIDVNKTVFDKYTWHPSYISISNQIIAPRAEIYYGAYHIEPMNTRIYSSVVAFTFGEETLFLENGQYRFNMAAEFVPFGIPGSPDYMRREKTNEPLFNTNWGPAVGISYIEGREYKVIGPTLRSIWAFPQIDSQFSIYARRMTYEYERINSNKIRWNYGIRGDIGFSLLTAYFAVGRDYGFSDDGLFKSDTLFSVGITFSFTISQVPVLKDIERWLYSKNVWTLPNN